jgi:hypothetical protein
MGPAPASDVAAPPDDTTADELAIFGGQTRVLALRHKRRGKSSSASPESSQVTAPSVPASPGTGGMAEFPWLDELIAANNMNVDMDDPAMGLAGMPTVRSSSSAL